MYTDILPDDFIKKYILVKNMKRKEYFNQQTLIILTHSAQIV